MLREGITTERSGMLEAGAWQKFVTARLQPLIDFAHHNGLLRLSSPAFAHAF